MAWLSFLIIMLPWHPTAIWVAWLGCRQGRRNVAFDAAKTALQHQAGQWRQQWTTNQSGDPGAQEIDLHRYVFPQEVVNQYAGCWNVPVNTSAIEPADTETSIKNNGTHAEPLRYDRRVKTIVGFQENSSGCSTVSSSSLRKGQRAACAHRTATSGLTSRSSEASNKRDAFVRPAGGASTLRKHNRGQ